VLEEAWKSFARQDESLNPILQKIECPVFLAWAKDDFVVPLKGTEPTFQLFPNHRVEVFNGGHAAFLEDPDRFERSLRDFLMAKTQQNVGKLIENASASAHQSSAGRH
jgi:pimeloyl-ACP methyl ester carboxylesterase